MKYAILSDIHSNLAAFEAVLADLKARGGVDELWCLGDVIGYGPDPHECIQLLRSQRHLCVAGNHDWAAIGNIDTSYFNLEAAAACRWTASKLTQDDILYLRSLPLILQRGDFTLVHGSPREPIWEYILSKDKALDNFAYFDTRFCFVGHSHSPFVFELDRNICIPQFLGRNLLLKQNRLVINCGGVGQPRDYDARASYAILDTEEGLLQHYRVGYDIFKTQQKMIDAHLPFDLISRLSVGC